MSLIYTTLLSKNHIAVLQSLLKTPWYILASMPLFSFGEKSIIQDDHTTPFSSLFRCATMVAFYNRRRNLHFATKGKKNQRLFGPVRDDFFGTPKPYFQRDWQQDWDVFGARKNRQMGSPPYPKTWAWLVHNQWTFASLRRI